MKLFLFESGTTGWSGSFKSCYYLATAFNKNKDSSVMVGFINESDYWKRLKENNISTIKFPNNFYGAQNKDKPIFSFLRNVDGQMKKRFGFLPLSIDGIVNYKFVGELEKIIRENNFDLIHANTSLFRDMELLKIAGKLEVPIVCHFRGYPYRNLTLNEKKAASYPKARFIAVSKSVKKAWAEAGVPENKIEVIYNAVRSLPSQKLKKNTINKSSQVRFLFVGRISKIKGIDTLIEALKLLENKNWVLRIVGDGDQKEKEEFLDLVKESNLKNQIEFEGYQKDVNKYYRKSDISIVPSLRDPCPRTVIESMQFSLPVVVSDVCGPSELIDDKKNGLHFKVGDPNDLARALDFLIKHTEKAKQFGLAGREKQKSEFSEDIYIQKVRKVYYDLLGFNDEPRN